MNFLHPIANLLVLPMCQGTCISFGKSMSSDTMCKKVQQIISTWILKWTVEGLLDLILHIGTSIIATF